MDAGRNNDEGDEDGSDTFDFGAMCGQFFVVSEFFAEDDKNASYRIGEAMDSIRDDSYRMRQESHYNIKNR